MTRRKAAFYLPRKCKYGGEVVTQPLKEAISMTLDAQGSPSSVSFRMAAGCSGVSCLQTMSINIRYRYYSRPCHTLPA